MHIAFQGEIGAFSEEAARTLFPEATVCPCATFEDVFEAVTVGRVDRGVIPIENAIFGSVPANYDLLRTYDLRIVGELRLRIRHHMMALPGATLSGIRRVISHPQALGQCQAFLRTHLPEATAAPVYDTAGAARMVAGEGDSETAAIASERAAVEYGLVVLAAGIETDQQNYTRFLVLAPPQAVPAPPPSLPEAPYLTSLVFAHRENVPGALFRSLAVFALRDLNLRKIESRPLVGSPGQYLFYLDLDGSTADVRVQRALQHLDELAAWIKVLGVYPEGPTVG
jgi:prephenate dehydratase